MFCACTLHTHVRLIVDWIIVMITLMYFMFTYLNRIMCLFTRIPQKGKCTLRARKTLDGYNFFSRLNSETMNMLFRKLPNVLYIVLLFYYLNDVQIPRNQIYVKLCCLVLSLSFYMKCKRKNCELMLAICG